MNSLSSLIVHPCENGWIVERYGGVYPNMAERKIPQVLEVHVFTKFDELCLYLKENLPIFEKGGDLV